MLLTGTAGTATASGGIVYGPEWREIVNAETGLCVGIRQEDGADAPGARVQQGDCTGVDEQHWLPTPVPGTSNIVTFTEGRNHLCLDVHLASEDRPTLLQQWPLQRDRGAAVGDPLDRRDRGADEFRVPGHGQHEARDGRHAVALWRRPRTAVGVAG